MRSDLFDSADDVELIDFFVKKLSTTDIALSIEAFIRRNYDGRINFPPCEYSHSFILFGDFELATVLKTVIKELTLARTCDVFFEYTDGDFIIAFRMHESATLSQESVTRITAEADHVGLSARFEDRTLRLAVPTHKFSTIPIYNRNKLRFYSVLYSVFSE